MMAVMPKAAAVVTEVVSMAEKAERKADAKRSTAGREVSSSSSSAPVRMRTSSAPMPRMTKMAIACSTPKSLMRRTTA